MADKNGLKLIGWLLGGVTAAVMVVAALLVHDAVANPGQPQDRQAAVYTLRGSTD
jgi:hypothetical protein